MGCSEPLPKRLPWAALMDRDSITSSQFIGLFPSGQHEIRSATHEGVTRDRVIALATLQEKRRISRKGEAAIELVRIFCWRWHGPNQRLRAPLIKKSTARWSDHIVVALSKSSIRTMDSVNHCAVSLLPSSRGPGKWAVQLQVGRRLRPPF